MPTPEEEAALAAEAVEKKAKEDASALALKSKDREDLIAELDAKITARDQALLETIKGMLVPPKEQPKPDEKPSAELEISSEEFWRDPSTALNKFFQTKIEPALRSRREESDTSGVEALVATRKMELKAAVGADDWTKYSRFFEQIASKTDPNVLKESLGLDAVWRLARSYGDDAIRQEEEKRRERNANANLQVGGGGPKEPDKKIELNEDEAKVAESMGLSPELYKKYSKVEEVEIGGARKPKK